MMAVKNASNSGKEVKGSAKAPARLIDIARAVGVSSRVVSQVLLPSSSNSARVSEQTAARVREAAERLGYLPNLTARQLAGAQSKVFGVLTRSFSAEAVYKTIDHLEREASRHGYRLLIGQTHEVNGFASLVGDMAGRGVDGIAYIMGDTPECYDYLKTAGTPVRNMVFIGPPRVDWADWVGTDLALGIHKAVTHLHAIGRRHIALLQPQSIYAPYTERIRGFREGLKKLKLKESNCPLWLYEPTFDHGTHREDIHHATEELLVAHPKTDAIVVINDLGALFVFQYLQGRGISVPEVIAVTGFDNLDMAQASLPSLTTIDQNAKLVAAETVKLLMARRQEPDKPFQSIIVEPKLIRRNSTLPL